MLIIHMATALFLFAVFLSGVDLFARILHYFFPTVPLFKTLMIRDWKWPMNRK